MYSIACTWALPLVLLLLGWRAYKRRQYRAHWRERFGWYGSNPLPKQSPKANKVVWIHAVSVGETRAAEPLVTMLMCKPLLIILTHTTPTGRATGANIFAKLLADGHMQQVYLPYDYSWAMRLFLRRFSPSLGIVMETEVWPNLMAVAEQEHVPVALVNARLSKKSLRKGLRFQALMKPAAQRFCTIVAQSSADAERIALLSERSDIVIAGSTKFDVTVPIEQVTLGQQWRGQINRSVLLLASSRDGEEEPLFTLWKTYCDRASDSGEHLPLLVIVPRHPERFGPMLTMARAAGLSVSQRTDGMPSKQTQVWVGNSMGELFAFYALANVTLMGGSFGGFGSQNCLEAMAVGCPVIVGPSRYNFAPIIEQAIEVGAVLGTGDMPTAVGAALNLLSNQTQRDYMAASALAFCAAHKGATKKTVQELQTYL